MEQLQLTYDPALVDAYPTAREFVAYRLHHQGRQQKSVAADMDLSPSHLSRKLAQSPGDSMRFTLDDFERFVEVCEDVEPVLYLVGKWLAKEDRVAKLQAELDRLRQEIDDRSR